MGESSIMTLAARPGLDEFFGAEASTERPEEANPAEEPTTAPDDNPPPEVPWQGDPEEPEKKS